MEIDQYYGPARHDYKDEYALLKKKYEKLQKELEAVKAGLRMAREEITNQEIRASRGQPGFNCDVIDKIDELLKDNQEGGEQWIN